MRTAVVLALLLGLPLACEDVERRVKALIVDLGSDDAETRERATAALIAVGPPAEKLLEGALETSDAEVRARARQALDAIRVEKRIGPSAWIALPAKETALAEAFEDLARQAGRKLDASAVDLAGRTAPGGLGRMPIWEALDRLARAGGCSYALPFSGGVTLQPGPLPEVPTCHDGPFRLIVDEVTVTRTMEMDGGAVDATTDVQMTLEWEPHVRPLAIGSTARITAAVDDQGGSLKLAEDEESFDGLRPEEEESPSHSCWTSLGAPSPGATRIDRLEGELDVVFLMEREEAVFDAEARRARGTTMAGPVEVQLTGWSPSEASAQATITVKGLGAATGETLPAEFNSFGSLAEMVRLTLRGTDGRTVVSGDLSGTTTYGGQDRADLTVGFDSLPPGDFELVVAVVTKTLSRPVKFAFKGIPLP